MKTARYILRGLGIACLALAAYGIYDNYRRCGKLFQFNQLFDKQWHHEHWVIIFGLDGIIALLASFV